jgi:protein-S-isoprenylcysteine O-methyltransferase Ste14
MSLFDAAQIAFLVLSVSLSLWNTWRLKRQQISVWVLAHRTPSRPREGIEIYYLVGLVFWIALILVFSTHRADPLPRFLRQTFFDSTALKSFALVLLALSLLLHSLALHALGPHWRVGTDPGHPGALVTRGIYAYSRNPILLGMILYALAIWLCYANLLFLSVLGVVVGTVRVQIRQEERFLTGLHGEPYTQYRKNVGRYFTWARHGPTPGTGNR